MMKTLALIGAVSIGAASLTGCSAVTDGKQIVRISHSQSEIHPEHLGLLKFEELIEEKLGDKYDIQIYPNELLGSSKNAIELCQTGAIDFVIAATANLETFDNVYEIFSMPYLFTSEEAYKAVMNDSEYMRKVYETTEKSGFEALAWYTAGSRSFYAKKPINTPADLKGMKMRVQQSPASVNMMNEFGAAAAPMSFGEVYTAIQAGVIDGAENNELALTNNKHGEVAKYYSYNKHQMVPDMLIGSTAFLDKLSDEERKIFEEAAIQSSLVEQEEWDKAVEVAKKEASENMGVQFIEVDVEAFRDAAKQAQTDMLEKNPKIQQLYNHIQEVNERY